MLIEVKVVKIVRFGTPTYRSYIIAQRIRKSSLLKIHNWAGSKFYKIRNSRQKISVVSKILGLIKSSKTYYLKIYDRP